VESNTSLNARIIRGRLKRTDLEAQEIREEIDRIEGYYYYYIIITTTTTTNSKLMFFTRRIAKISN